MGANEIAATSNLRVTLGRTTTSDDVDAFVDAIGPVVRRARARSIGSAGLVRIRETVSG
jgi:cysteine desulfurase